MGSEMGQKKNTDEVSTSTLKKGELLDKLNSTPVATLAKQLRAAQLVLRNPLSKHLNHIEHTKKVLESQRLHVLDSAHMKKVLESQRLHVLDSAHMKKVLESQRLHVLDSAHMKKVLESQRLHVLDSAHMKKVLESQRLHVLDSAHMKKVLESQLLQAARLGLTKEHLVTTFHETIASQEIEESSGERIKHELSSFLDSDFDFSKLSDQGKRVLLFFFLHIIMPALVAVYVVPVIQDKMAEVEPLLMDADSKQGTLKKAKCLSSEAASLLNSCRFVLSDGLRLRIAPNRQADIILNLPRGKIVDVLDASRRSWLEIEVRIGEEYYQGWVARRYTGQFKH
jgi:hypothetical protein